MDKNTIMLVVIFLLIGIIAGLTLSNKMTPESEMPTGKVAYAGVQPELVQIGQLQLNQLNKIVINEDKVICYIKLGQGAGISCVNMPEENE